MKSKTIFFLILLIGTAAQYFLLQMYSAGRRQGEVVSIFSFIVAAFTFIQITQFKSSSILKKFALCIIFPTVVAAMVLLFAEKIGNPSASIWSDYWNADIVLVAMTLLLAGGWLPGIATYFGFRIISFRN
jgi:hypothetical protein